MRKSLHINHGRESYGIKTSDQYHISRERGRSKRLSFDTSMLVLEL